LARVGEYYANKKMFKLIVGKQDFAGVQYYYRKTIGFKKAPLLLEEKVSDLGLEIYPEGLYRILKKIGELNLPVYITENGLADRDDLKRGKFIRDHLTAAHRAISEGVDVRGYFHWSLLDNFEWDKGFWPRFGLVGIDYKTQKRTIRKSAYAYRDIIRGNGLELEIK
jgi:beta-glucosidase